MAYGLNFYSEWRDDREVLYRTEILRRDYSGVAKEVTSGENPFVYGLMDDAASDPFYPVRTQKAEIQWIADEESGFNISDIFITDEQEYKVVFKRINEDESTLILWQGFLTFTDCEEPFQSKPYPVQLTARCGLSLLRDQYFLDSEGRFVEGARSIISVISKCLAQTRLDLEIDTHIGLAEENGGTNEFLENIDFDSDGIRGKTAFEALEGVLNSIDAFITQTYGSWTIRGLREQQADAIYVRRYSPVGVFIGANTAQQVKSIGSQALADANLEYINIQPMADVKETLADPFSIVKNNIAPGILTNRLSNGTFNPNGIPWGVNLNNMTGWAHSPEPKGWRIEGDGKPDDPYRFVMIGSVKTTNDIVYDSKNNNSAIQAYTYISNVNPITIFRDGGQDSYPNIRIVVTGAFKMRDGGKLMIACRLNDGDKEYVQWLEETGNWKAEKKFIKRVNIKVEGDTPHNPEEFLELQDIPLQTFEFKSSKIPDYILRSGEWLSRLYFSVYPVTVGVNSFPEVTNNFSPAISLEDFSVSITTETAYEQDHTYEIDAKKVISNGDKYEYDTIIADKINILTAHQKRELHRVMTGYLTVGSARLTKAWKRVVDGVPVGEFLPLQHLTLTERVRQLCGKRRILEGSFLADLVSPTDSIRNLFDPEDESYYTITSWSWDVKRGIYQLRLHELDFTPLPDEVITLTDKQDNGRGKRLYTGVGGSSSAGSGSGSGSDVGEEILLDDPEPFEYEVLVEDEEDRVCDIGELLQSGHVPDLLEAKILSYPPWLSEISLYRGEDLDPEDLPEGGILRVLWQGKPEKSGDYQILIELVASDGADYILSIPLVVEPSEDFIESWPPVFVDVPPLYFIAGKTATRELDLTQYLDPEGEHDGTGLSPRLLSTPYWVSDSRIVFMNLSVTGLPDKPGTYWVTYEISDIIGRTTTIAFQVIVLDPSFMTYELLDTSGSTPVVIGTLPGVYELPERWDVAVRIKGDHDFYKIFLKGGGSNADVVNRDLSESVLQNEDGEYRFFKEDNGVVTEAGQFSLSADTYLAQNFIFGETIDFVLYDEEFLDLIKFFLTQASAVLGEIVQDGTSSFIDPVIGNFGIEIEGIEHDKAVIEFDLVAPVTVEHTTPEFDFTYTLADEDFPISVGQHTVTITLYLDDVKVATRYAKFETVADKPKPIAGLKLVSMIANTTDYSVIGELPEVGGSFELPANWNVLSDAESAPYDYEKAELWELRGGGLVEINTTVYTRQPDYNSFVAPVTKSEFFIFRELNSTKIGDVHSTPSTFRALFTRRIGGATGQIVAILKSDFSFGGAVDIEDTPIKQPGTDVVDVVAGAAMSESVVSFIKTLDVRVDNATIEIFNPATPAQNYLRVKDKGITLAKLADITGPGLLGKTTAGSGVVSVVPIVNSLVAASDSNIPTALAVKNAIADGTTWQAVMAKGNTSNIAPIVSLGTATTGLEYMYFRPTDYGVGKPSLSIGKASTANIWSITVYDGVNSNGTINFNVQNLTQNGVRVVLQTRQVIGANGLTGGGDLSTDRSITPVYGTTAGTVAEGNHVHAVATTTVAGFMSAADKIKLNNLPATADTWQTVMVRGAVTSIKPTITIGSATTSADYLAFQPSDFGIGKPMMYFSKAGVADKWNVLLYDGSNNNGTINFYAQNLTYNDVRLVREDRQINTGTGLNGGGPLDTNRTISVNFGTTGGTVAEGNHTHVAAQITDFVSVSRNAISGVGNISYNSATGVISYTGGSGTVSGTGTAKRVPIWTGPSTLGDSSILFYDADGSSPALMYVGISGETDLFVNGALRTKAYTAAQLASKTKVEGEIARQSDGAKGIYWYDGSVWERLGGAVGSTSTLLVGASGTSHSSAALEVRSTTKGFLPPRMTCAQKTAIANPEIGLEVYQTDVGTTAAGTSGWGSNFTGAGKYIFEGIAWIKVGRATS